MNVLVAIDLREQVPPLMTQVIAWARRLGATIDLLYAEGYVGAADLISDPHVRSLMAVEADKLRAHDLERLRAIMETVPEALRGEVHLVAAAPAEAVVERAPAYDAVIVGTHGRTGLAHFWLGSQAERIIRMCQQPVVVLRLSGAE